MVRFCVRAVPSVYSAFPREQLGDVSGGRSEIYEIHGMVPRSFFGA